MIDIENENRIHLQITESLLFSIEKLAKKTGESHSVILLRVMRGVIDLIGLLPQPEEENSGEGYDQALAEQLIEAILSTVNSVFPTVEIITTKKESQEAIDFVKKLVKGKRDTDEKVH